MSDQVSKSTTDVVSAGAVAYRHSLAGADYVPRRFARGDSSRPDTNHWFYEPRLRPDVYYGQTLCTPGPNSPGMFLPNSQLSECLEGGVPCETCNARWPL